MTNASPLVVPTFSKEPLLGTNPIAMSVPSFNGSFTVNFCKFCCW